VRSSATAIGLALGTDRNARSVAFTGAERAPQHLLRRRYRLGGGGWARDAGVTVRSGSAIIDRAYLPRT